MKNENVNSENKFRVDTELKAQSCKYQQTYFYIPLEYKYCRAFEFNSGLLG